MCAEKRVAIAVVIVVIFALLFSNAASTIEAIPPVSGKVTSATISRLQPYIPLELPF